MNPNYEKDLFLSVIFQVKITYRRKFYNEFGHPNVSGIPKHRIIKNLKRHLYLVSNVYDEIKRNDRVILRLCLGFADW